MSGSFKLPPEHLMSNAPRFKDGTYPSLDLWLFVAQRLIDRINAGGVIAKRQVGHFAGGESAFLAICSGDVSQDYFTILLDGLKKVKP